MSRLIKVGLGLMVCQTIVGVSTAASQRQGPINHSPKELVNAFSHDAESDGPPSAATEALNDVLVDNSRYSHSFDEVLDRLEDLALNSSMPNVRARAAVTLSQGGSRNAKHPRKGTVARLERLYRHTTDHIVQGVIVASLSRSAERPDALTFLEAIATQKTEDYPGSALDALVSISVHEDAGRAALKRLHDSKAVSNPEAAGWLGAMAQRGYRGP